MDTYAPGDLRRLKLGLRYRVVLFVAVPVSVLLAALILVHYSGERRLLQDHIQRSAIQLAQIMKANLQDTLATDGRARLSSVVANLARTENVRRIQVLGRDGQLWIDSRGRPPVPNLALGEWAICPQAAPQESPCTMWLPGLPGVLRVSEPLNQETGCVGCDYQSGADLGFLLVDVDMGAYESYLSRQLTLELLIASLATVLITFGLYWLISRLILIRLDAFKGPLAGMAEGDFSMRLPARQLPGDELDELTRAFNHMLDRMSENTRLREERRELRERAIVEERERIAGELHDGLAQFLGYFGMKLAAARIHIKTGQVETADSQLQQIETAAQAKLADVRETILGLKAAGQIDQGLDAVLETFIAQFRRLTGMPVELTLAPGTENLALGGEAELQLLRMVQEALTNVRKHAGASQAWVRVRRDKRGLELTVVDNGKGLPAGPVAEDGAEHFGLLVMRDRAKAIGAALQLEPVPGGGTCVRLFLPGNTE